MEDELKNIRSIQGLRALETMGQTTEGRKEELHGRKMPSELCVK